jgi:hypothetical protein
MPGLQNIQIPGALIASLYKDTLIALDSFKENEEKHEENPVKPAPVQPVTPQPQQPAAPVMAPTTKWFLGDNAKGIVILVQDNENVYLAEESLQLLSGILSACRLNLGDVAIVNTTQVHYSYSQIKEQTLVRYFFLFNVPTQSVQLPFAIPHYQVQQYDGCTFLTAPDLTQMMGNAPEAKLEKSKLWLCLKKIFNL